MSKTFLKGDCAPKITPSAKHPWRRAVYPWAALKGRYRVDEATIDARRKQQLDQLGK